MSLELRMSCFIDFLGISKKKNVYTEDTHNKKKACRDHICIPDELKKKEMLIKFEVRVIYVSIISAMILFVVVFICSRRSGVSF